MSTLTKAFRFVSALRNLPKLADRLATAEKSLAFMSSDKWNKWLWENQTERMDATLTIFDDYRRKFHLERYVFAADYAAGKDVVDCACGTGYGSEIIERAGARSVVGVDIDQDAISYASKKHPLTGSSRYTVGSALDIPLDTCCADLIVSFETIEHVQGDQVMLAEFFRILRPGGTLIISTPNMWPLELAPYHVKEYNYHTFRMVLEPFFSKMEFFNQNSGTQYEFNRGQPAGLVKTTPVNRDLAECFLAVCEKTDVSPS